MARLVSLGAVDAASANAPHVWWLTYHVAGLVGVIILEAPSLIQARLAITVRGIEAGATFTEGHELGSELVAMVPPAYIGQMLTSQQAYRLEKRFGDR